MRKLLRIGIATITIAVGAFIVLSGVLNSSTAQAQGSGGNGDKVIQIHTEEVINGETRGGGVMMTFTRAAELPEAAPDRSGLFLSRDGDLLTVGQGAIEVTVDVEVVNDEEPVTAVNATHSGGEAQVRLTDNTQIYRDTTEMPEVTDEMLATGEATIQSTVEAGSAADIGENMVIRAWGSMEDGVLVADVLVYEAIK
ncbi:MAG: hypothetical protein M9941_05600 [Anaerolineae bacterium]|nr:hypothetical protein [Anaerolineae bacterium]